MFCVYFGKKILKDCCLIPIQMCLYLYLNIFWLSLEDNIQMATVCTLQIAMLQVEGLTTPHPAAWQRQAGPGPACSSRGGTGPAGCAAHRLLPLRGHQVESVMQPVHHHLSHHLGEERLYLSVILLFVMCNVLYSIYFRHISFGFYSILL